MAEFATRELLLPNEGVEHGYSKHRPFGISLYQWVLKSVMWLIFVTWCSMLVLFPTELGNNLFSRWTKITIGSVFGLTGSVFLTFSAPILIIAFMAFFYVAAFPRNNFEKKNAKSLRCCMWTFPILVNGPFGVVSASELIGILVFTAYVLWAVTIYTIQNYRQISNFSLPLKEWSYFMLEHTGLRLGSIGLFCLSFLFLPVARGSVLLRLIAIPFEHATRYHVWLGHLTMAIFTLHGACYVISWALQGSLLDKMLEWKNVGIANQPGVYSLLAGLLMWATSLHPVRKNHFELFFYTHQLYVFFIIFLAMHVGDFIFSIAAGPIFLFILDRFLRFCQSRTTVDVISAACYPCGTVELILSKPANLRYNSLSFIFLQVRELSWLQWHPFSVSSSPLDGRYHISVLIKVLGKWTAKLRDVVSNDHDQSQKGSMQQPLLTASIEGPYGHESPYHLMYENLILVAGGIGISPFLAILSDILQRISKGGACLPKNVMVIWAVKRHKELSLLSTVNAQSICPSYSDKLHLDIRSYVTQESEPPLEDGKLSKCMTLPSIPISTGGTMSCLVGTGNTVWSGIYIFVSTIGFIIFFGLVEVYYIGPFGVISWWYRGLLFTVCMVASVVTLGGIVVFRWNKWENRKLNNEELVCDHKKKEPTQWHETDDANLVNLQRIRYGCRPDFPEIFSSFSEHVGRDDVGVIVCGPPSLQSSVAKECRSRNMRGKWNQTVFHFHSHSFDL